MGGPAPIVRDTLAYGKVKEGVEVRGDGGLSLCLQVLVEDRTARSLAQRVCSRGKGAHLAVGTKCSLSQGSSRCEEPLLL